MQKTQTHAKPVQLCKHVVKPRIPKGKKPPGDSDQPSECGGGGGCGPGQRAGIRAAPTVPRTREEQLCRGPQTPRPVSSLRRRPSSCHPSRAAGPNLGHLKSRRPAPCPDPQERLGQQLLGLEPRRRRRRAPNGQAGTDEAAAPLPAAVRQLANNLPQFPPSSQGPRTLTPPTRSHTIPEASGARALCEAALPPRPGPEMAAEQENLGSDERRSDWTGAGPAAERSAAVALAAAPGLGERAAAGGPRGPRDLSPAARGSGF